MCYVASLNFFKVAGSPISENELDFERALRRDPKQREWLKKKKKTKRSKNRNVLPKKVPKKS